MKRFLSVILPSIAIIISIIMLTILLTERYGEKTDYIDFEHSFKKGDVVITTRVWYTYVDMPDFWYLRSTMDNIVEKIHPQHYYKVSSLATPPMDWIIENNKTKIDSFIIFRCDTMSFK